MKKLTVIETEDEDIAQQIVVRIKKYGDPGVISVRSVCSADELSGLTSDILVLSPGAARKGTKTNQTVSCGILLLPGDTDADFAEAECIVTYGMSAKNTITLSSIGEESCILALQRELITVHGDVLERQEIMINGGLKPDALLAVAGALLLLGLKLSDINE
jgi:hypothetical protein